MKPAISPAKWTNADVHAFKALARGEASAEQQKRALDWVINAAAGTYEPSYRPDPYETAFAEGRRFVGLQTVKMVNMPVQVLQAIRKKHGGRDADE